MEEARRGTAITTKLSTDEVKDAIFEIKRIFVPAPFGNGGYFVKESHKDCGIIMLFELNAPARVFTTFVDGGKVYAGKVASSIIAAALLTQGICFKVEEEVVIPERIRRCMSMVEN